MIPSFKFKRELPLPFTLFAELTSFINSDVLTQLKNTRSLFSSYIRIRSLATSATSPELIQARSELESTLQDLSNDLADLVESVKAVEHDPYKYGLEIDEVSRRRRVVEEVGGEVEDMREELAKAIQTTERNAGIKKGESLPSPSAFESTDNDYAEFEQQRQLEIMHEQDDALDDVFQTVGNLRQQANDMGRELEEQGELLTDVDKLADRVGGRLQSGIKKVGHVIKQNEGRPSYLDSPMSLLT